MRDVDFGVCLLLFFLFFLSLGSVCGVDGDIADDVARRQRQMCIRDRCYLL